MGAQIFFAAAAASLRDTAVTSTPETAAAAAGPREYALALRAGVRAISEHGGAAPGDCTMLDALHPAAEAAVAAAEAGVIRGSRNRVDPQCRRRVAQE